ncbi:hypothetical protein FG386_000718 [Cryptosporidium ryanae]|uniref:uncharacterized protein n=1 Tax=Cryptosporidium ryanae TaxID=515981 RepID=UPI00351A3AE6|nr:hypothetical protein FG386_000718 [Cryptosporidium ryanae]
MTLRLYLVFCCLFLFISLHPAFGEHLKKKDALDPESAEENISKQPDEEEEEDSQETEDVFEVENAIGEDSAKHSQSPEQILEACNSLNDSFSKECSTSSLEKSLSDLVEACRDSIGNLSAVEQISTKITNEYGNKELSDLSECSAMVFTTSIFISSVNENNEEQLVSESLEVESLETDESESTSEYEQS